MIDIFFRGRRRYMYIVSHISTVIRHIQHMALTPYYLLSETRLVF